MKTWWQRRWAPAVPSRWRAQCPGGAMRHGTRRCAGRRAQIVPIKWWFFMVTQASNIKKHDGRMGILIFHGDSSIIKEHGGFSWGYYGDVMNDLGKVNHDLSVLLNPGMAIYQSYYIIYFCYYFINITIIVIYISLVRLSYPQMAAGGLIGF